MMVTISRNFDLDQSCNLAARGTYEPAAVRLFGEAGADIALVVIDVG
jgi:hypothetical protein